MSGHRSFFSLLATHLRMWSRALMPGQTTTSQSRLTLKFSWHAYVHAPALLLEKTLPRCALPIYFLMLTNARPCVLASGLSSHERSSPFSNLSCARRAVSSSVIESSSWSGETASSARIIWMSSCDSFERRWIGRACPAFSIPSAELDTASGKDQIEEPHDSSSTYCLVL